MKKKRIAKIIFILIVYLSFSIALFALNSQADTITAQSEYGTAPTIDGIIDGTVSEWEGANKMSFYLYPNISDPQNGLPIDLWLLQTKQESFISIQFELVNHNSSTYIDEYIAILISESEAENPEDFKDAKVVQFDNITNGDFSYTDYNVNNMIFSVDSKQDGMGAAKLDGTKVTYEFAMPINDNETDPEDVYLYYGVANQKAYKIVFGTNEITSDDFVVENNIIIELQYAPIVPIISLEEILLLTFNILIFSSVGVFYIYYIYRITQLKKKIKKIRR